MNQVFKCCFYITIVALIISCRCTNRTNKNYGVASGDSIYLTNELSQPGEDTWKFIEDLKAPMWTKAFLGNDLSRATVC